MMRERAGIDHLGRALPISRRSRQPPRNMLPMSGRAASLTSSIASARSDFEALVAVFAVLPKNLQRRIRSARCDAGMQPAAGAGTGAVHPTKPKLVGTGAIGNAAVVPSADGNTAIVGGLDDNGGAGAAWVYKRSALPGPGWSKAREPPSPGTGDAHIPRWLGS